MATKDWKKTITSKNHIRWNHRASMTSIDLVHLADIKRYGKNANKWVLEWNASGHSSWSNRLGVFKTKSQALAYAKAYMRKH